MPAGEKIKLISQHAKQIRKKDEKWQEAIRRATIELRKQKKI